MEKPLPLVLFKILNILAKGFSSISLMNLLRVSRSRFINDIDEKPLANMFRILNRTNGKGFSISSSSEKPFETFHRDILSNINGLFNIIGCFSPVTQVRRVQL